jgi:hypothetical protein
MKSQWGVAADRPPVLLRPLHAWFFFWERVNPSVCRVLAVIIPAALFSALLVGAGLPRWLAAPVAIVLWIGLAVLQEHDERVVRSVDEDFLNALRERADPILTRAGFNFISASSGSRARPDDGDVILYETDAARYPELSGAGYGCLDLWIRRNARAGILDVSVGPDLTDLLGGEPALARRVTEARGAVEDAEALAAAFSVVFGPSDSFGC